MCSPEVDVSFAGKIQPWFFKFGEIFENRWSFLLSMFYFYIPFGVSYSTDMFQMG